MTVVVQYTNDEDLLMEAARYAVQTNVSRNSFMSSAKNMWFVAAIEAGVDPQANKRQRDVEDRLRQERSVSS